MVDFYSYVKLSDIIYLLLYACSYSKNNYKRDEKKNPKDQNNLVLGKCLNHYRIVFIQ